MAQFTVHRNPNPRTAQAYPYLLDVQSDAVARLPTRAVIPLARLASLPYRPIIRLMPAVEVLTEPCVLVTQELAGITRAELGEPIASLFARRQDIVAALDLLFTGI